MLSEYEMILRNSISSASELNYENESRLRKIPNPIWKKSKNTKLKLRIWISRQNSSRIAFSWIIEELQIYEAAASILLGLSDFVRLERLCPTLQFCPTFGKQLLGPRKLSSGQK